MIPLRKSSDPNQLSDPANAEIDAASDRYSDAAAEDVTTAIGEITAAMTTVGMAVETCRDLLANTGVASFLVGHQGIYMAILTRKQTIELARLLATLEGEIQAAHYALEMQR